MSLSLCVSLYYYPAPMRTLLKFSFILLYAWITHKNFCSGSNSTSTSQPPGADGWRGNPCDVAVLFHPPVLTYYLALILLPPCNCSKGTPPGADGWREDP